MMSDPSKSQDDLSIEEILGSIRRIIAEDEDDAPQAAASKPAEQSAYSAESVEDSEFSFEEEDEEPLELTNKIEPQDDFAIDLSENDINFADEISNDAGADFAMTDHQDEEPAIQAVEQPAPIIETVSPVKEEKPAMTNQDDASLKDNALLSSNAAIATAAVMAKLARQAAITEEGNSNVTLEAMVKEMIRPMLREWLDANLPDLVQKMVERELERLTKRL